MNLDRVMQNSIQTDNLIELFAEFYLYPGILARKSRLLSFRDAANDLKSNLWGITDSDEELLNAFLCKINDTWNTSLNDFAAHPDMSFGNLRDLVNSSINERNLSMMRIDDCFLKTFFENPGLSHCDCESSTQQFVNNFLLDGNAAGAGNSSKTGNQTLSGILMPLIDRLNLDFAPNELAAFNQVAAMKDAYAILNCKMRGRANAHNDCRVAFGNNWSLALRNGAFGIIEAMPDTAVAKMRHIAGIFGWLRIINNERLIPRDYRIEYRNFKAKIYHSTAALLEDGWMVEDYLNLVSAPLAQKSELTFSGRSRG